ncbi:hypothetical protein QV08_10345, partial [Gallibacterium salpingitidis]
SCPNVNKIFRQKKLSIFRAGEKNLFFCRPENLIGMRISKSARGCFLLLRFLCTSKENEVAL